MDPSGGRPEGLQPLLRLLVGERGWTASPAYALQARRVRREPSGPQARTRGGIMERFRCGAIALCLAAGLPAILGGQGGIASAPAKFLAPAAQTIAVRAGRLFDSRTGTMGAGQ